MKYLLELLKINRSYRRFDESIKIPEELIKEWVSSVRFTASTRNIQALKYHIVIENNKVLELCSQVHWAGYLKAWSGPIEGERPSAFLIQLLDTTLSKSSKWDEGLQLEAITLMAAASGYGACIMAAFDKNKVKNIFSLPEHLEPITLVALGKPIETVQIVDFVNSVEYYRTEDLIHHVPKRSLEDILV